MNWKVALVAGAVTGALFMWAMLWGVDVVNKGL